MGLFDFVGKILGLSPPSSGEAMSIDEIKQLMEVAFQGNRTDQQGLFTGFGWNEDPNGRWTQTQTVNDALLPGLQRLVGNANQSSGGYQSPEGFDGLLDALISKRQGQSGQTARAGASRAPATNYRPPQPPNAGNAQPGNAYGGVSPGGALGRGVADFWFNNPQLPQLPRYG